MPHCHPAENRLLASYLHRIGRQQSSVNHVINWDQAKVIDRESNRVDRWIKEVIHIRKEQDKSMNRDEGSYQLSHIYDNLFARNLSGD